MRSRHCSGSQLSTRSLIFLAGTEIVDGGFGPRPGRRSGRFAASTWSRLGFTRRHALDFLPATMPDPRRRSRRIDHARFHRRPVEHQVIGRTAGVGLRRTAAAQRLQRWQQQPATTTWSMCWPQQIGAIIVAEELPDDLPEHDRTLKRWAEDERAQAARVVDSSVDSTTSIGSPSSMHQFGLTPVLGRRQARVRLRRRRSRPARASPHYWRRSQLPSRSTYEYRPLAAEAPWASRIPSRCSLPRW